MYLKITRYRSFILHLIIIFLIHLTIIRFCNIIRTNKLKYTYIHRMYMRLQILFILGSRTNKHQPLGFKHSCWVLCARNFTRIKHSCWVLCARNFTLIKHICWVLCARNFTLIKHSCWVLCARNFTLISQYLLVSDMSIS